jgi:hypothetical protein
VAARKRTEITIETERVVVIRRRNSRRGWCRECGREVDMVGLSDAGKLAGTTQKMLGEGDQGQKWHVSEGADGTKLICLESLLKGM